MRICSFVQTCSDDTLEEFVSYCKRLTGRTLFVKKEADRVEIHAATKNKEEAKWLSKKIEIAFNFF